MAERGRPRSFDRQQALAKAMEAFWTQGYEATSIADLTAAMGIASPSLYAAFGSKEALFLEAVALYGATEGELLWAPVANAPTARAAVEAWLLGTAKAFTRRGKPRGCLVTMATLDGDDCRALQRKLGAMRAQSVDLLAELFARGVTRGEIDDGVDLRAVARYVVTVQQGMSIQARDGASRAELEQTARAALAGWDALTRTAR
ncbi:MAG: TetR/AcrR family transcriptional regulator [Polyangiales bacterium]